MFTMQNVANGVIPLLRNKIRLLCCVLAGLLCLGNHSTGLGQDQPTATYRAPAGVEFAKVVPGGRTILPNGRFLEPAGQRLYTGDNLWNVIPSPDGQWIAGFCESGIVIYAANSAGPMSPSHLIPWRGAAFCGAFTKDSQRLIVSSGDAGHGIQVFSTKNWSDLPNQRLQVLQQEPILKITADPEAYIIDLVLSADENYVYAADVARQRVVVFSLAGQSVIADVPAGREPFSIAISPGGESLFVANIGVFDYSLIPTGAGNPRGIAVPAFGFPSEAAEKGTFHEGRDVPGLGDPRVPDANSVWSFDLTTPTQPQVRHKQNTGILIHAPADSGKAVGGSSPNAVLVAGEELVVANANNDTVQFLNASTLEIKRTIKLAPEPTLAKLRGVIPSGMCLSDDRKTLYVCAAGLNAVAVIDVPSNQVVDWIPSGWFPTACRLSPDQAVLYIASQKGIGRGPRGPKHRRTPDDERFGLDDMPGMISVVKLSERNETKNGRQTVVANNGMQPLPESPVKFPSDVEYIVFITKENHTFDGIFGGLEGSTSEPDYAEFGDQGWLKEKGQDERIPIMPNHIRLAKQFSISDNFYMEPQASGDGHRWLVGVYPSLWTTRVFYSGWDFKKSETAKGRIPSFGSNGSQIPEDYLENGSLWEHLDRGGITFRNYGEGFEFADNDEGPMTNKSGAYTQVNFPMPKVLYDNTDFNYPAYNTYIPDIARADWFVESIETYRTEHEGKLPRFVNITLCNDHGAAAIPENGYPYVASYMADNDLALGKIVAYLSSQPEWKKMAIFVTQDDSGGDNDSIDRHRSYVMLISPWSKRTFVSHQHTSIMSIIKTIYTIFDLGPNNLFDATATDLSDMFDDRADFTPYKFVPADPRVFKPEDTFDATDPDFKRRRQDGPPVRMDDPDFVESLRDR